MEALGQAIDEASAKEQLILFAEMQSASITGRL